MKIFVFFDLFFFFLTAHSIVDSKSNNDELFPSNLDYKGSDVDPYLLTDVNDDCSSEKSLSFSERRQKRGKICHSRKRPIKDQQAPPFNGEVNPSIGGQSIPGQTVHPKDSLTRDQLEDDSICPARLYGAWRQIPVCDSGMSDTRKYDKAVKSWIIYHASLCRFSFLQFDNVYQWVVQYR